ncbi:hypothetical protein Tco_1336907 [Tanacetum coccineum]
MSECKKQVKKIARRVWTEVEVNLKRNADSYLFDLVRRGWKPFKKNPPRGYIDDFNRKGFIPSLGLWVGCVMEVGYVFPHYILLTVKSLSLLMEHSHVTISFERQCLERRFVNSWSSCLSATDLGWE